MSRWVDRSIKDLCVAIVDCVNKTAPSQTDPTPYKMLRTTNVRGGWVDTTNVKYVDEPTYAKWTRRMVPEPGDIILTREAPFGGVGMLRSDDQVFLGQRLVMYRPALTECDPDFLMYSMMGPTVQAELKSLGSGSTVEHLRVPDCEKITIPCPPLDDQQLIGSILRSLDNLIENNRRRVELLDAMARSIYREWFVKFRYPGHEDGSLIDSALGPIPEGWNVSSLAARANITMGQSPKSEFYNDEGVGRPFHQGVTDFGQHFPPTRKWCSVEGRSATVGDILLSVRAPVGRINIADTDITIGRGLSAIRAKDGRQALLLGHLREVFSEEDTMGNDGAIFKSLGKAELAALPVTVPPDEIADAADAVFADNLDMIRTLTQATQRLSSLRDLLLPKLVTGQIDVSTLDLDALAGEQVA